MFHVPMRRMYILQFSGEMSLRSICSIVCFNSDASSWILCLDDLSIDDSGMLKSFTLLCWALSLYLGLVVFIYISGWFCVECIYIDCFVFLLNQTFYLNVMSFFNSFYSFCFKVFYLISE